MSKLICFFSFILSFTSVFSQNTCTCNVAICNQTWMTHNLTTVTYRNGDTIPQVKNPTAWANLTTGAWCYYNNDSTSESTYGKLYNWYAVTDPRGLAPWCWSIPSFSDWTTLIQNCLVSDQGIKMKTTGNSLWTVNIGATNSSGFSAVPGGFRNDVGSFFDLHNAAYFWSRSHDPNNPGGATSLGLTGIGNGVNFPNPDKRSGLSVRCIKQCN